MYKKWMLYGKLYWIELLKGFFKNCKLLVIKNLDKYF
jgi:hypothetical protein